MGIPVAAVSVLVIVAVVGLYIWLDTCIDSDSGSVLCSNDNSICFSLNAAVVGSCMSFSRVSFKNLISWVPAAERDNSRNGNIMTRYN